MMLKKLLTVFLFALLTVTGYATAQQLTSQHPDVYVVKKGDTLWDISARFLNKPWLWPELWQANPHIANPHLIYPGDRLSLKYLGGNAAMDVIRVKRRALDPVPPIPLKDVRAFLRDLRVISDHEMKALPYVVSIEEDRLRGSSGHVVYARGIDDARPGDMYAIMRPTQKYHRTKRSAGSYSTNKTELNFRGDRSRQDWGRYWYDVMYGDSGQPEYLGTELMRVSTGQVTRPVGGNIDVATLMLADAGKDVKEGDRLMRIEPRGFDFNFFPHPPADHAPYGKLRVMAITEAIKYGGQRQVVALSGGAADGIDNGMVFALWNQGEYKKDKVANRGHWGQDSDRVRLPDEFVGHVMVFRTFDRMSYGLVMDGVRPVQVGAIMKHPDQRR